MINPTLFEVKFSNLPFASENIADELPFLISGTTIPGSENSWHIDVLIIADIHEMFVKWHTEKSDHEAFATIVLYNPNTQIEYFYRLNRVCIEKVGPIALRWSENDYKNTFRVDFKINGPVEKIDFARRFLNTLSK